MAKRLIYRKLVTTMRIIDSLLIMRATWLSSVSHLLAKGEGVRESFWQQLERFFDLLQHVVETGNPAWLNPLLDEWVHARTESELANRETSLPPIINSILLKTYEVAQQELPGDEAHGLMSALLPAFTHAIEYTSRQETELHFEHIRQELDQARLTLERLDKSKSDFISIAAHELKTPLTLIEGYSSMLREYLPDRANLDSPAVVLLQGVENGTRRLHEIIDDMIDVSMIDNNLLSLNFQPVWVNRLLSLIEKEFAEVIQERQLRLDIHPFPGSDAMMFADGERLYQALRNVIANAIKYTPDGGHITVNGRELPGFMEMIVIDSGIGIDPEDQSRIFEKFGRIGSVSLHSSGKTKFKGGGPGLGLPITKGIIEAHGGAIWVESEGCNEITYPGATFHILLPFRSEPPDDRSAKLFRPLVKPEDGGHHSHKLSDPDGTTISG